MRASPPSSSSHAAANASQHPASSAAASSGTSPSLDGPFSAMLAVLARADGSDAAAGHGSSGGTARRGSDRPPPDDDNPSKDIGAIPSSPVPGLPLAAAIPASALPVAGEPSEAGASSRENAHAALAGEARRGGLPRVFAAQRLSALQPSAGTASGSPATGPAAGSGVTGQDAALPQPEMSAMTASAEAVTPPSEDGGGSAPPPPPPISAPPSPAAAPPAAALAAAPPPLVRVAFMPHATDPDPAQDARPDGTGASEGTKPAAAASSLLAEAVDAGQAAADGQDDRHGGSQDGDPSAAPVAGGPPAAPADSSGAPSAGASAPSMSPVAQVQTALRHAAATKSDRIDIHLQPETLGAIEVRLHFYDDGSVAAQVTAEHADTLRLLAADAPQLEQSLRDSGLQAQAGCLAFSLRGDADQQPQGRAARENGGHPPRIAALTAAPPLETAAGMAGYGVRSGAIDIRI
jgi:hypothetical protein